MTNDPQKGPREEVDPLSATAMFLRTFDRNTGEEPENNQQSPPESDSRAGAPSPAARIKHIPFASPPGSSAAEPQRLEDSRPSSEAPGEFTRIFVQGGARPAAKPAPKSVAEGAQNAPAAKPSRLQGFSTPGASDAAAADHDFTQFFKAASKPSAIPKPLSEPFRREAPVGYGQEKPPVSEDPAPSVTSLIASLSSSQELPAAARESQAAPYRPEPATPNQRPPQSAENTAPDPEGVTRLIQRLSEPTPKYAPAERPEPAPASPVHAEPGEFTRMISRAEASSAMSSPAAGPRPIEPLAAPPRPAAAIPAVPIAPPMAVAPPAFSTPKSPAPAAAAIAAPKSKLDAMVPILLVINTFLLLVLLIAVIFLIKSR